jgi:hypothetical protein
MAEQEVIKHTRKMFKIMGNKNFTFWHKLKEFLTEVIIIVIAITLSIWLHNMSEHRHEQSQVKEFLTGLKDDLIADIADARNSLDTYQKYKLLYSYLSNLDRNKKPNQDSLKLALTYLDSYNFFRVHKSRFTGFLSAGKILTIENDTLTQDILDYYQEIVPALQTSEDDWIAEHTALVNFVTDNCKDFKNDLAQWQTMTEPKAKHLSTHLIPWPQLIDRYNQVIKKAEKITNIISKIYPDK